MSTGMGTGTGTGMGTRGMLMLGRLALGRWSGERETERFCSWMRPRALRAT
jgi:hypothetical protein